MFPDKNNFDMIDELENEFSHDAKIHIRIKKRNAKKCITTIEGFTNFEENFRSFKSHLSSNLNCSCSIMYDDKNEMYFQLSGDKRDDIKQLLLQNNICGENSIVVHGY